jgi:cytochrome P450
MAMFRGRNFRGPHGMLLTGMQSKARIFMTQLHEHQHQQGGREVELQARYLNLTLDAIGHVVFGMDLGALRGECSEFQQAFSTGQRYMHTLMLSTLRLGDLALLYLTPQGWAFRKNVAMIDRWASQIIEKACLQQGEEGKQDRDGKAEGEYEGSLLRVFMDPSRLDEHGKPFSLSYIKEVLISFIIAGRDTTAEALTWATYLLITHPHALWEVRKEVDQAFRHRGEGQGEGEGGRWHLEYEDLESMVYLQAVVTETLRLYPSVPKELRTASQDDTLPDGTKVYRGDLVSFLPYVMGRSRALWGDDAEAFRPERHLAMVKGEGGQRRVFKSPNPFVFSAFNAGPRACMGQQLAYMEMKVGHCLLMALAYI